MFTANMSLSCYILRSLRQQDLADDSEDMNGYYFISGFCSYCCFVVANFQTWPSNGKTLKILLIYYYFGCDVWTSCPCLKKKKNVPGKSPFRSLQCNPLGQLSHWGSASISCLRRSHGSKTLEVRVKLEAKIFLEMIFVWPKNQTFITSYVSWIAKISTLKSGLSILKKNPNRDKLQWIPWPTSFEGHLWRI